VPVVDRVRPGEGPGGRRGEGPGGRRRSARGRRRLALLGLALAALAAGGGWLARDTGEPAPPPAQTTRPEAFPEETRAPEPPAASRTPESAGEPRPAPAPEPSAPPLPALAASDPLARQLAGGVSSHALLGRLLAASGVVDRFVLVVDNLAEGLVPRRPLAPVATSGAFLVTGVGDALRIDPASYGRFDPIVAAIASLDATAAVAAYRRLAPLCEESYRALGYPEGGFEARLRAALALLRSTPEPSSDPALIPETLRYEFADPALESLPDAQKLMLRIGPAHRARVRAKLVELEAALGPP